MPNPLHSDGLVDYEEPRCTRFWQAILFAFCLTAAGWNSMYQVSNGQGCALLRSSTVRFMRQHIKQMLVLVLDTVFCLFSDVSHDWLSIFD